LLPAHPLFSDLDDDLTHGHQRDMSPSGHELPRHFKGSAAELPPKAVTPVINWRGG
jgi:hypothetical protein